jgi:REP element-mobilizing transposase RayT
MKNLHRNSQKRVYLQGYIYYIVGKTQNNYPYFKEQLFCDVFIEELKICKELKDFKLSGFSLIYDHFNLLIKPNEVFNISQIIKSLKENVSRDINVIMGFTHVPPAGDTPTCRLRGREELKISFLQMHGNNHDIFPKFKWQKSFHNHYVRDEKDYLNHYEYAVYNHLKHGLPEKWQYTSLNYPEMIDYPDF